MKFIKCALQTFIQSCACTFGYHLGCGTMLSIPTCFFLVLLQRIRSKNKKPIFICVCCQRITDNWGNELCNHLGGMVIHRFLQQVHMKAKKSRLEKLVTCLLFDIWKNSSIFWWPIQSSRSDTCNVQLQKFLLFKFTLDQNYWSSTNMKCVTVYLNLSSVVCRNN